MAVCYRFVGYLDQEQGDTQSACLHLTKAMQLFAALGRPTNRRLYATYLQELRATYTTFESAAIALGLKPSTLRSRMRKLGIARSGGRDPVGVA